MCLLIYGDDMTIKEVNAWIYHFGKKHTFWIICLFPFLITAFFIAIIINPANIVEYFNHELLLSYTPDRFTMPANEVMFKRTAIISFFAFYFTIFLIIYSNFLYINFIYYRFFQHKNRQTITKNFLLKMDDLIAFAKPVRLFIFFTIFMALGYWAYPTAVRTNEVELFKMSIGALGMWTLYFINITTSIWFYCGKRCKRNISITQED